MGDRGGWQEVGLKPGRWHFGAVEGGLGPGGDGLATGPQTVTYPLSWPVWSYMGQKSRKRHMVFRDMKLYAYKISHAYQNNLILTSTQHCLFCLKWVIVTGSLEH